MKLFGSVKELFSLVFRDASSNKQLTIEPNQTTTYTADRTIQAPPQDANSTLVSEDATQTLTNKTISGASNTISNVNLASQVTGVLPTANGGTGQNSTATFPASGVVVTEAASETLTNKSLSDSTTSVVDVSDATKKIKFDAAGTTGTSTTLLSSQTVDRTLTLPDATDTVAVLAASQSLTNKNLASSTNTLTGATAGSFTNTGTITLPTASTTLVGRDTTDSLTNKKFLDAVVIEDPGAGTNKITIQAPTLSGDYTLTLPTTDGTANQVLQTDGSGVLTWADVASSGGSKNYLSSIITSNGTNNGNGDFELGTTTGWSLAHSALTSNFPSTVGTAGNSFSSAGGAHGGSAASGNLSITATSSSPLAKTYSGSYASSAATTAGDMLISDAFNIDTEDQAKVLSFKFAYKAQTNPSNGNFSGTTSNSFGVAIYDVTNAAWIMPAGVWNIVQSSGVGIATGTFQTTSNSTQYQIAFFNANASAGAITMYVDDFSVGPQVSVNAPAMADWQAYAPTISGMGSITNNNLEWRRVGDSVEIRGSFTAAGGSTTVSVALPSGLTSAGTSKIPVTALSGLWERANAGAPSPLRVVIDPSSTTFGVSLVTSPFPTKLTGSSFGAAETQYLSNITIPIAGWSSNSVMSSDTDTRVVAAIISGDPASATSGNPIIVPTVSYDSHAGYNASTGGYTCPVSGIYKMFGALQSASSATTLTIYKNASSSALAGNLDSNGEATFCGAVQCNAGDIIDLRPGGTVDATSMTLNIERTSGPAVVAASESVNARYHFSGTQSIANNSTSQTLLPTAKDFDTHGAFNTGTGIYTVPVSGKYRLSGGIRFNAYSASDTPSIRVYKNGTLVASNYTISFATSNAWAVQINDLESCNAGDTLEYRAFQASGSPQTIGTDADSNYITFERVGN